ncbi:hypothetical protein [Streptomyces orinoci]|uniref:Integral membrane protein n=1 Tax=Streptomyces orinoci TaxID=67339 RepID=A0ABV3JWP7_STRON|nr:hypothetical protein [Streptomyces orinoci]
MGIAARVGLLILSGCWLPVCGYVLLAMGFTGMALVFFFPGLLMCALALYWGWSRPGRAGWLTAVSLWLPSSPVLLVALIYGKPVVGWDFTGIVGGVFALGLSAVALGRCGRKGARGPRPQPCGCGRMWCVVGRGPSVCGRAHAAEPHGAAAPRP